jgi:hypothetical protein
LGSFGSSLIAPAVQAFNLSATSPGISGPPKRLDDKGCFCQPQWLREAILLCEVSFGIKGGQFLTNVLT